MQKRTCVARWHDATWTRAVGSMVAWHSFATQALTGRIILIATQFGRNIVIQPSHEGLPETGQHGTTSWHDE